MSAETTCRQGGVSPGDIFEASGEGPGRRFLILDSGLLYPSGKPAIVLLLEMDHTLRVWPPAAVEEFIATAGARLWGHAPPPLLPIDGLLDDPRHDVGFRVWIYRGSDGRINVEPSRYTFDALLMRQHYDERTGAARTTPRGKH